MSKLIDQFSFDWDEENEGQEPGASVNPKTLSDDRATLLYLIDTMNKNLFDFDGHPVRKTRGVLDQFAKELISSSKEQSERVLFRFRQFFSSYRIDEYTYIQKTFEDFRGIIWDFIDQLSEDIAYEENADNEVKENLSQLREAVEANSIDSLKQQSRQFIDFYMEHQSNRDNRRSKKISQMQKSLSVVKKKLVQANENMRLDHLTGAYNRKSFDEKIQQYTKLGDLSGGTISMLTLDIDFFKKINDNYGHPIGDYILVECVNLLKEVFHRDTDFVARVGGEEFSILLPDHKTEHAVKKAEELVQRVRKEVFVKDNMRLNFTVSVGIAERLPNENIEHWMKRADQALYKSKNDGRDRYTIAEKLVLADSDVA